MSDLRMDTAELRSNAARLRHTRSRLSRVEEVVNGIAPHTGHSGLASKVRDFGGKWDITRGKLEQQLGLLADTLDSIAETFDDLDRELAQQAKGTGTP